MRVNLLKRHFLDLEADHMKKLNDREKTLYKSKLEDSEDYWKYLVHDMVRVYFISHSVANRLQTPRF